MASWALMGIGKWGGQTDRKDEWEKSLSPGGDAVCVDSPELTMCPILTLNSQQSFCLSLVSAITE